MAEQNSSKWRRGLSVLVILGLLVSSCVSGEYEEGTRVDVELVGVSGGDHTSLFYELDVVFDHVELLNCGSEGESRLWGRLRSWALPTAFAAHLPDAPNRLLGARRWSIIANGEVQPSLYVGRFHPLPGSYCGIRFGFYSALPQTRAVEEGMKEGETLRVRWENNELSTSIGFDREFMNTFTRDELLRGVGLRLELDLEELSLFVEEAKEEGVVEAREFLEALWLFLHIDLIPRNGPSN